MVTCGHCTDDRNRTHHVHLQGYSVQSARIQFSPHRVLCCWFAMDIRPTLDAEVEAGAAQSGRYGVPRPALDVYITAAVHDHV